MLKGLWNEREVAGIGLSWAEVGRRDKDSEMKKGTNDIVSEEMTDLDLGDLTTCLEKIKVRDRRFAPKVRKGHANKEDFEGGLLRSLRKVALARLSAPYAMVWWDFRRGVNIVTIRDPACLGRVQEVPCLRLVLDTETHDWIIGGMRGSVKFEGIWSGELVLV
ncbi:hypothetical protein BJ742DRAFT_738192 [Cladochytrium replicatum]|nr:hypothetical protein BJ742DRAFT_738192 [Cladochytrium replicatum]